MRMSWKDTKEFRIFNRNRWKGMVGYFKLDPKKDFILQIHEIIVIKVIFLAKVE